MSSPSAKEVFQISDDDSEDSDDDDEDEEEEEKIALAIASSDEVNQSKKEALILSVPDSVSHNSSQSRSPAKAFTDYPLSGSNNQSSFSLSKSTLQKVLHDQISIMKEWEK